MGSRTILLVEDNEDDVFFMQRAIKGAEIFNPVQVVTDGQQAIDYLEGAGSFSDRTKFPVPSLILLDLKLPNKSGLEVLEWIRQHPRFRNLIVIILSTSRESRDIEGAYSLGANAFLVKPPGATQLLDLVKCIKKFWLTHNQYPLIEAE